ncbi:rsmF, partial [Symbiodinium sp. CCMP2456]
MADAASQDFMGRVIGAASQGAVGAVVAASLSAVTEPLVNNMLVNRATLGQAIKELATNIIMQGVDLPPTARGAALGSVFCTITLPITNYRFRKSMNMPVTASNLYQAYPPTVLRDIIYGIARNKVSAFLISLNPAFANSTMGRVVNMFTTVVAACVLSAPGNELRGYCLQPAERKQSFSDFFQPIKFIRSTSVGAVIMGISLAIGSLATPQVERLVSKLREYLQKNPVSYILLILFFLQQILQMRRQAEL